MPSFYISFKGSRYIFIIDKSMTKMYPGTWHNFNEYFMKYDLSRYWVLEYVVYYKQIQLDKQLWTSRGYGSNVN